MPRMARVYIHVDIVLPFYPHFLRFNSFLFLKKKKLKGTKGTVRTVYRPRRRYTARTVVRGNQGYLLINNL